MKYTKEVREFFKKYPEFNNVEKHLVTSFSPYQRRMNEKRLEEAVLITTHLELFPDESVKTILNMYYEGQPISKIAKYLGKSKLQTSRYLFGLRERVKRFALEGDRINIKNKKIHREVVLMHKGKMATVYLVNTGKGELAWVRSDGLILPEDVQELLG